jgi:hypothetical protein
MGSNGIGQSHHHIGRAFSGGGGIDPATAIQVCEMVTRCCIIAVEMLHECRIIAVLMLHECCHKRIIVV